MIPKKIHYCWFGRKTLPKIAKKCIASWKTFLPDYEVIEWNENKFDINCCDYVKEAYQAKKYAFVSDYARFKILYEYGGIYFDTDVELIKSIDDIIKKGPFMGFESDNDVAPGLGLAVNPGLGLYKEFIDMYNKIHFIDSEGKLNLKTVVQYTTEILYKYGLQKKNEIQYIRGVYVYPKDYFNPIEHETGKIILTENTRSIHHFMASWCSFTSRKRGKFYQFLARCFNKKTADFIKKVWHKIKFFKLKK